MIHYIVNVVLQLSLTVNLQINITGQVLPEEISKNYEIIALIVIFANIHFTAHNSLPDYVTYVDTVYTFKTQIDKFWFTIQ